MSGCKKSQSTARACHHVARAASRCGYVPVRARNISVHHTSSLLDVYLACNVLFDCFTKFQCASYHLPCTTRSIAVTPASNAGSCKRIHTRIVQWWKWLHSAVCRQSAHCKLGSDWSIHWACSHRGHLFHSTSRHVDSLHPASQVLFPGKGRCLCHMVLLHFWQRYLWNTVSRAEISQERVASIAPLHKAGTPWGAPCRTCRSHDHVGRSSDFAWRTQDDTRRHKCINEVPEGKDRPIGAKWVKKSLQVQNDGIAPTLTPG